jgi:hypothetical protein
MLDSLANGAEEVADLVAQAGDVSDTNLDAHVFWAPDRLRNLDIRRGGGLVSSLDNSLVSLFVTHRRQF